MLPGHSSLRKDLRDPVPQTMVRCRRKFLWKPGYIYDHSRRFPSRTLAMTLLLATTESPYIESQSSLLRQRLKHRLQADANLMTKNPYTANDEPHVWQGS